MSQLLLLVAVFFGPKVVDVAKGEVSREQRIRLYRAMALVVGFFWLGFFIFGLWYTAAYTKQAYFFTPTRFWELATGALVAIASPLLSRLKPNAWWMIPLSLVGWAGIAISAFWLTARTPFPGAAALLPVGSTALLIAVGVVGAVPGFNAIYKIWPIRFAGDISYSLYLWHWPLLILGINLMGRDLVRNEKLVLGVLALYLAASTKKMIEDWGINAPVLRKSLKRTFIPVLLSMLLICASCWLISQQRDKRLVANTELNKEIVSSECGGYHSLLNPKCTNRDEAVKVSLAGRESIYYMRDPICRVLTKAVPEGEPEYGICDYSNGKQDAQRVLALGDSHIIHWLPALEVVAKERGWQLYWLSKGGCPLIDLPFVNYEDPYDYASGRWCRAAIPDALKFINEQHYDRIIYSTYARNEYVDDGKGHSQQEIWTESANRTWNSWLDLGIKVDVIADVPKSSQLVGKECLNKNSANPILCSTNRYEATRPNPLVPAALINERVNLIDMTNYFCDAERCFAAIGGIPIYWDENHLNAVYTRQLGHVMGTMIDRNPD